MLGKPDSMYINILIATELASNGTPITHIDAQDVNRDGFPDVLAGNKLYINPLSNQDSAWTPIIFNPNISRLFFFDVDHDGLPDILGFDTASNILYWIEALDPEGIHWSYSASLTYSPVQKIESSRILKAVAHHKKTMAVMFKEASQLLTLNIPADPEEALWSLQPEAQQYLQSVERNDTISYDVLDKSLLLDFDQDGRLDIAIYDPTSNKLSIRFKQDRAKNLATRS